MPTEPPLGIVTIVALILLMIIGGSPGSCAGGIKTTTLRVLLGFGASQVKGREQVVVEGFAVDGSTVNKAMTLTILAVVLVLYLDALGFGGGAIGLGTSPSRTMRLRFRSGSGTGMAVRRAFEYGCSGEEKIAAVGAVSTIFPRYITATRSLICRTIARSCAINR